MYTDKVKELKEKIKECLKKEGFNFRIYTINGNNGTMQIIVYDGRKRQIIEFLEKNFKNLIEIKESKEEVFPNLKYINIKTLIKKEGIDLEIEKLELKIKELKEQRRKQQEQFKREEKIKELRKQLEELE